MREMLKGLPLIKVNARNVNSACRVKNPVFSGENWQVNQNEFAMQVQGIGSFYVGYGKTVEYSTEPETDPQWVKLYLNGQILVALLHQRKILNFHASSFIHGGRGIMILGETGAGKSSLTASFTLNGAGFLSDDLTPVIFRDAQPYIWPINRDIKLREHTVGQLNISRKNLRKAEKGTGKHYMQVEGAEAKNYPLHTILKIEIGECNIPEFHKPEPAEKFSLLRSEICSWEILAGMPETETEYLHLLLQIVQQVNIVRVMRPAVIEIPVFHAAVNDYLAGNKETA